MVLPTQTMEENKMNTFETPNGKKIQMKIHPNTVLIKLEFATGGELPQDLSGLFTTEREATIAINRYLAKQETKIKVSK